VASKVYYQLGEYNESMIFALSAGKLFNLNEPTEYEDTIIGTMPTRLNQVILL
jgi:26S proteasome regulatory subunit N2